MYRLASKKVSGIWSAHIYDATIGLPLKAGTGFGSIYGIANNNHAAN